MEELIWIFGTDENLNIWNMVARSIVVFLYTLLLLRISGRRSYGMNASIDIIVLVLIGAILSRTIVGASAFLPTICAGLCIAVLHRFLAVLCVKYHFFGGILKGKRILLYHKEEFLPANLSRALMSITDIMEGIRIQTGSESLEGIDSIYMERNGTISIVKKN